MTYYINPMWFYLIGVAEMVRVFFLVFGVITIIVGFILVPVYLAENCVYLSELTDEDKLWMKLYRKIIIIGAILISVGSFIPSKETCIEMMVASQLTYENASNTKEEVYEIIDYVTDKIYGEDDEE